MKKTLFVFVFMLCLPLMQQAQSVATVNITGQYTAVITGATTPPQTKTLSSSNYLSGSSGFVVITLDPIPGVTRYEWTVRTADGSHASLSGAPNSITMNLTLGGTPTTTQVTVTVFGANGRIMGSRTFAFNS